jgi:hypothetical protein
MRIEIDISLFTEKAAVGRVSGKLELPCLPRIGETLSFSRVAVTGGFSGHVVVEQVIHSADSSFAPLLSLSDIVLDDEAGAKALGEIFATRYGLFFEPFGD